MRCLASTQATCLQAVDLILFLSDVTKCHFQRLLLIFGKFDILYFLFEEGISSFGVMVLIDQFLRAKLLARSGSISMNFDSSMLGGGGVLMTSCTPWFPLWVPS